MSRLIGRHIWSKIRDCPCCDSGPSWAPHYKRRAKRREAVEWRRETW